MFLQNVGNHLQIPEDYDLRFYMAPLIFINDMLLIQTYVVNTKDNGRGEKQGMQVF